jgi:hypothetical protein
MHAAQDCDRCDGRSRLQYLMNSSNSAALSNTVSARGDRTSAALWSPSNATPG